MFYVRRACTVKRLEVKITRSKMLLSS